MAWGSGGGARGGGSAKGGARRHVAKLGRAKSGRSRGVGRPWRGEAVAAPGERERPEAELAAWWPTAQVRAQAGGGTEPPVRPGRSKGPAAPRTGGDAMSISVEESTERSSGEWREGMREAGWGGSMGGMGRRHRGGRRGTGCWSAGAELRIRWRWRTEDCQLT